MKKGLVGIILIFITLSLFATPYSFPVSVIIIDPGHGGVDPGAIGIDGSYEKDVNLAISLKLAQIIQQKSDIEVILTRTDDTFLSLEERVQVSNSTFPGWNKSALFLSIHVNGSTSPLPHGYEFLVREMRESAPFISPLSATWAISYFANHSSSILRRELNQRSFALAHSLGKAFSHTFPHARYRGVKEMDVFVTNNNIWPSVLVEAGFITNKEEGLLMKDPSWIDNVASSIWEGISEYML